MSDPAADLRSPVHDAGVEEILPAATQELSRSNQDHTETKEFPFHNVSETDPYACPAELCKTRQPSVWSCNVYKASALYFNVCAAYLSC